MVTCLEDTRHNLESGDYVTFSEIRGMTELNGCAPRQVKVISPYSFSIGDTTGFSEYTGGGRIEQGKMPKTFHFVRAAAAPAARECRAGCAMLTRTACGCFVLARPRQRPLAEALEDPGELLLSDFAKFDRPQQLHVGFQALHQFAATHQRLPRPRNEARSLCPPLPGPASPGADRSPSRAARLAPDA